MKLTIQPTDDPIADYITFLDDNDFKNNQCVTKDRIEKQLPLYTKAMNTLLMYPDIFADIMTPKDSKFSLFFEQRMVLRQMQRKRQFYGTFTRGFSKSFLANLAMYQRCMFVPNYHGFAVAGTKKQIAAIAKEKVIDDLWVRFPLLRNEMKKFRVAGKMKQAYKDGGDHVEFDFTNGSIFDVIGGAIRGGRRNGGIFDEVILLDGEYINESVIPLLNTIRYNKFGEVNPNEPQGSKIFITSAGYVGTYAYEKLVETLCFSIIDPKKYAVMGGSYKVLIMHGRLVEETMREILSSPSFKADSADREYRSIWSHELSGAAFSKDTISKLRKVKRAEYAARKDALEMGHKYVIGVDVSKDGAAETVVIVCRLSFGDYSCNYREVNTFVIASTDFSVQANILKQTAIKYKASLLIYDANGVGAGLRDWLNKPSRTKDGMPLEGLGIINPPPSAEKTVIKYNNPKQNIVYEIKSGGNVASQIHSTLMSKISSGSIKFLVSSAAALQMLETQKKFVEASTQKKDRIMRPYRFTDQLEVEFKNLDIKDTSDALKQNIIIERRNKNIQKDFFSACEYVVYGAMQVIELPYYKKLMKQQRYKVPSFVSGTTIKKRRNNNSLSSRRRNFSRRGR